MNLNTFQQPLLIITTFGIMNTINQFHLNIIIIIITIIITAFNKLWDLFNRGLDETRISVNKGGKLDTSGRYLS